MRFKKTFPILLAIAGIQSSLPLANAAVSPAPESLFSVFGLPITNSMVTSWVIVILLIVGIRMMIGGRPQLIPGRGQAIIESLLVGLKDMIEPIVGKKAVMATLPFVLGFFVYILIQNWSGLLPGVGTLGMGYEDAEGHFHITRPWIRPANADWNGTMALAIVAMVGWAYIILKYAGFKALVVDLFGNKADKKRSGHSDVGYAHPHLSLCGADRSCFDRDSSADSFRSFVWKYFWRRESAAWDELHPGLLFSRVAGWNRPGTRIHSLI
jgi:F-type H+-transporting ATPase subunit a